LFDQNSYLMFEILISHLENKITLTPSEKEIVKSFFEIKKLKRKEFFLREGDYCEYLSFVSQGILKSFTVDEKGIEHITLFAMEGWWISDFNSFLNGEKSILNISAIEPAEVLLISLKNYEEMIASVPVMNQYFRILYQNSLVTKDHRLMVFNSFTAEEKYVHFAKANPEIIKRVSHNLIASYLGLAPETVSRIRKRIVNRKESK